MFNAHLFINTDHLQFDFSKKTECHAPLRKGENLRVKNVGNVTCLGGWLPKSWAIFKTQTGKIILYPFKRK